MVRFALCVFQQKHPTETPPVFFLQSFHTKWVKPDDRIQPGCHLWAHADALARGNCGRHDEHQVPEHCGGDTYRELHQGYCLALDVVILSLSLLVAVHHTLSLDSEWQFQNTNLNIGLYWFEIHSTQCSFLDLQVFHQPPDPNVPLPQPQSRPGSRRSRAICLSTGPRKPRSLYTPTLCLADAESEYQSSDYRHRSSHHNFPKPVGGL